MNDQVQVKIAAILCSTAVSIVVGIAWAIAWSDSYVKATAMKEGYSRKTLPGVTGVHWVKDEKNDRISVESPSR